MTILAKYITRQALVTLMITLGVFTFVLLLGRIRNQLSEMLVNGAIGLDLIGKFLLLVMPAVLSFSLPMAMLATALLVFGRMSADHEITAMRASGIGLGRVAAPVIVLATLMGLLCLYINTTLSPHCRFAIRTLFLRVGTEQPMALLQEGSMIRDFPGYLIYVGHKSDRIFRKNDNVIEDVIIRSLDDNGQTITTLFAKRGVVTANAQTRILTLDLYDVRGDWRDPNDPTNIQKIRPGMTMQRYPIELDLGRVMRQAAATKKVPDFDLGELLAEIRNLRAQGIYPAAALMETHWRIAGAVACVTFTLIGIPLGIKTSRRETSIGIAISLGLATSYFFMTVLANALRNRPQLYPEAILWFPNLAFEVIGLWLLWRVARV